MYINLFVFSNGLFHGLPKTKNCFINLNMNIKNTDHRKTEKSCHIGNNNSTSDRINQIIYLAVILQNIVTYILEPIVNFVV